MRARKETLIRAAWSNEKELVDTVQNIKKQLEELELEAAKAERKSDYETVAKIRYGEMQEQQTLLKEAEERLDALVEEKRFTNEEVTANDIADIVARWTGIPVTKMLQSEKDKILNLEAEIGQRFNWTARSGKSSFGCGSTKSSRFTGCR